MATLDALHQGELAALELRVQSELNGPLTTRIIPVNYARAAEMAAHIKLLLSSRGTVSIDERTNTVIVRDAKGSRALSY